MPVKQLHHFVAEGVAIAIPTNLLLDGPVGFIDDQDDRYALDLSAFELPVEDVGMTVCRVIEGKLIPSA
jgi:hypothetical protein